MDDRIGSEVTAVLNHKSEAVGSTNETFKTPIENSPETELKVVANPELYPNLENGSEVITIVAQENDGEVYIFEKNEEVIETQAENSDEFIQVCDSSNASEVEESQNKEEINIDVVGEESSAEKNEAEISEMKEDDQEKGNDKSEDSQLRNYKNVILEDWEVEVPQVIENNALGQTQIAEVIEAQEVIAYNNENCTIVEVTASEGDQIFLESSSEEIDSVSENQKENSVQENMTLERKVESLKIPKSITKTEIVKILDESTERVVRPIVAKKDLFFSIELTKRLNQKLSLKKSLNSSENSEKNADSDTCNNNNNTNSDDRQKIVEILEADEVRDWKSTSSKSDQRSKENGNDMEITKAIKNTEETKTNKSTLKKPVRRTPFKKFRIMDKELERTIALQQLREEFPTTRKRSRTTKKVNHIPFIASTILEKALTSPEVTTALKPEPPKRRPCYLPENISSEESNQTNAIQEELKSKKLKGKPQEASVDERSVVKKDYLDLEPGKPNAVFKTYSAKRKSTDTESEIKSTIAAVAKALSESAEEEKPKPKKQKTVIKKDSKLAKNKVLVKRKSKLKSGVGTDKKRHSELEKLLGDEGAVRMLYDTQHSGTSSMPPKKPKFRTTTGIKKDLVLKTKLVKNAVMRLSGVGTEGVSLRGKRSSLKAQPKLEVSKTEEPLFSSTPNIVLYKPKKKHRAEASRILYRHSSSESFDSSEGYRRASIDADGLNASAAAQNGNKSEGVGSVMAVAEKSKFRKSELVIRRKVKRIESPKKEAKVSKAKQIRLSTETASTVPSKINLSNVPVRKSSRPRMISKKYSVWSSTSMDSLSVESLGLRKLKKASTELGKKLNVKEVNVLQYDHLFQVVLTPTSTLLKNSLSHEVLQELIQVLSYLSEDDNCKVVLLSSRGSTFCQGVDINQIISFRENERKTGVSQLVRTVREFVKCLSEFKKPVIVGVHGAAVGLGVTLLPYCDLVISSNKAAFYTPYVKLGQAPEGAPTHTFPRINRFLVSELLFRSHKMTATDALKYGLVTQIIPEERFEEELIVIAKNMASQPVQGIQSIKFLLRSLDHDEIDEILRAEGELLEEQWNNSECLNNIVKFLNSGELQMKHLDNS